MAFSSTDMTHLNPSALAIQHWDETSYAWQAIPTTVDQGANLATAVTNLTGRFDLQAPLLCPDETLEPDDTNNRSQLIWPNDLATGRMFDVGGDADWAMFQGTAGVTYTVRTQNLAPMVDTVLSVYEDTSDGLILLASNDNYTSTLASRLAWTAPYSDTFYIAVLPGVGSSIGCEATYELVVETIPGDVTGDCLVDVIDIQRVAEGWGTSESQYGYLSVLDQDDDGDVDIGDIQWVAARWGQTCS